MPPQLRRVVRWRAAIGQLIGRSAREVEGVGFRSERIKVAGSDPLSHLVFDDRALVGRADQDRLGGMAQRALGVVEQSHGRPGSVRGVMDLGLHAQPIAVRRAMQIQAGVRVDGGETALASRHRGIFEVRGRGLMLGMELVNDDDTPDAKRCDRVLEFLKDRGFLAGKTGPGRNVLTFMPPLVVERFDLEATLEVLDEALDH